MPGSRKRSWWQWLKGVLALLLLGAVVGYLIANADVVREVPPLSAATWLVIGVITGLGTAMSVLAIQRMLRAVGARTGFGEMFLLHNAAYLLNLLPAKVGTVLRARYLRHHHDFSYLNFGLFALALTLLSALITAAMGFVSLLTVYGLGSLANRIFALFFASCIGGGLVLLLAPLPLPSGSGRVGEMLRAFLDSRSALLRRRRALAVSAGWLFGVYLLGALRLGVIYAGMGLSVHPAGLLLLGALGQLSLLANLTPGGLGVRELMVGSGAVVLGVPVEAGLLAALIERAVGLLWSMAVGLPSLGWVWRRQPERRKSDSSEPARPAPPVA